MKLTITMSIITLIIGFFLGRYDSNQQIKFARIQSSNNMLLINDQQCDEKIKAIIEEMQKKPTPKEQTI